MSTPPIPAPGFFGKVPARGDFLARRLPPAIHAEWEAWLADFVVAARAALGDSWPDDWLTAPLWHFSLGSDLAPPLGAVGVMVASADRVGRLFPFTLIGPAIPTDQADATQALDDWSRAAEALTLAALEDDFDPDALDTQLVRLGPPPAVAGAARETGHWPLPLEGDWPEMTTDTLSDSDRHPPGPGQSAWWCRGSDRLPPLHLRCAGLPGPATSARMVAGGFEEAG